LCDYYASRFSIDTRGLRLPGLISHVAGPGGGTTDYAVEMFYHAVRHGNYTCFVGPETRLDMAYMPDAIGGMMTLMAADAERLRYRNAYNITAMSVTPEDIAAAIRKHMPAFEIDYDVDPVRQAIADSWPRSLDDSAARADWDWAPRFGLGAMTQDMLARLQDKLKPAQRRMRTRS
ncbi:MAG TPA: L-threonine 3-dehydrogenase, partial [Hyphomicrobium sp.]|nr:L-threonine 3-dehydrogenase [Hyphomicrobium sp.]